MGLSKKDKKKIEDLIKKNEAFRKALEEQGITINNLEKLWAMSQEAQDALLRAHYAALTEGGIIITPPVTTPPPAVDCGPKAHWDVALGKCMPDDPTTPPPTTGGEKDQYGISKIYKDKVGGVLITADKFTEEEFTRNYASGKPSENSYECEYKDSNKLENEEVTFYSQINGFKSETDTMSVKLLGNKHSDGSPDKWLIFQLMTDGGNEDNFQIEDPHPENHDNHQPTKFTVGESIVGKAVGFKAITFIDDTGKRHAETWLDFPVPDINNPPNNWRKYIEINDVASLDHGFLNATNGGALLRIDGTKKGDKPTTKFMSIRQIEPEGGIVVTPPTIPPVPPVPPVVTPPTPPTPPTTGGGTVLYDSNIGKWNRTITITGADPDFPKPFSGGKGMEMHASGNPIFKFDGTGVGTLEADGGHGRTYIDCNNNGSTLEYELRFNDTAIENHTCQLRSRHQEGDPPENRQGGDSFKIDLKTVGLKLEKFHNEHISGEEKPHGLPLKVGEWIKVKLTDKPDYAAGEIYQSIELNGQKVIEGTQKNLPPYLLKKEDYDARSYFWLRVNNTAKGSVSFKNIKLTAL